MKLVLADEHERRIVLSVKWDCLGELLSQMPRPPPPPADSVSNVQAWRLDATASGGQELTLTLQTPEGHVAAFRLTAGQLAGMATVAMHTKRPGTLSRNIH